MTLTETNADHQYTDAAVDTFAIARAYRGASDADINHVLEAFARPLECSSLRYYLVPSAWMITCLPFLLGKTDQRPTMRIDTTLLLEIDGTVSEEDEDAERSNRIRNCAQPNRSTGQKQQSLRHDLELGRDFHCVGTNVWNLVSEKFGYEVELEFSVVSLGNGVLAIDLGEPHQKINIPASGRFEYETSPLTDFVSDDDDDMFPGSSGLSSSRPDTQTFNNVASSPGTTTSNAIILLPPSHPKLSSEQMDEASNAMEMELPAIRKRKRYGSGLGNLGNTCFMNSTLQCLAHTEPLRQYFLSGDYENDLNRDNPLGTGGELATQFAELLDEMWLTSETTDSADVVYPRSFKQTLGRHAEQFLGYDQHDSQELATYLLDALHEDTNRVTKKPYIEKPEQGETEPDDEAANKAWNLHLKREDSRVLEHFMGQVKSHVQCPKQGCGRVSTTFDPFMYLSVPIPGATDRTLKITFVPLEGCNHEMKITMHKTGTVLTLQKKVCKLWHEFCDKKLELEDIIVADVWNGEVYNIYKDKDEIDKIRDTDVTFVYELVSSARLVKEADESESGKNAENIPIVPALRNRTNRIELHVQDLKEIDIGDAWKNEIDKYVKHMTLMSTLLNPKRATIQGLQRFYDKLGTFIDKCYKAVEKAMDEYEQKNGNDDEEEDESSLCKTCLKACQEEALNRVCLRDQLFTNVTQVKEVARLEYCEKKLYRHIMNHKIDNENKYREGLTLQVIFQRKEGSGIGSTHQRMTEKSFTAPLCLRIAGSMTVFEFRELLAARLPFKKDAASKKGTESVEVNGDNVINPFCNEVSHLAEDDKRKRINKSRNSGILVMRQIPMGFADQRIGSYGSYRSNYSSNQLGMLERLDEHDEKNFDPIHLADCSDEEECKILSECIGQDGQIYLYWPTRLCEQYFDIEQYESSIVLQAANEDTGEKSRKTITVRKCIEKYCQMEQLEETEMWFCNRCKEHVRAWKQFHIYRAPPILIIHLKRFHYSASTHRRDKIDTFVDFPLSGLDLTSEVMHWNEEEKPIYDCYAVSNHYGGLGGGHYTAYALNENNTWGHYDDSRISTDINVKEVISSAAYVLYYRRRNVNFDNTPDFPLPVIVQDCMEYGDVARIDCMDLDEDQSQSSSSVIMAIPPQKIDEDGDDYFSKVDYDSDHLPSAQ